MKWRQGFSGSKSTERRAICGWHEIIPTIGRSAPVVSTRRHKVLDNVFPNSLCSRLTESKFSGRSLASSVNLSRKNKSLPAPKLAWASIFFTAGLGQSIPVVSVHNVVMPRQQTVENLVRLAPAVLFFLEASHREEFSCDQENRGTARTAFERHPRSALGVS